MKRSIYAGENVNAIMAEAGKGQGSARLEDAARRFRWLMARSAPLFTAAEWSKLLGALAPMRDACDAQPTGIPAAYAIANPGDAGMRQKLEAMRPPQLVYILEALDRQARKPDAELADVIGCETVPA